MVASRPQPARLDESSIALACAELSILDRRLATLVARNGVPPLWRRTASFGTMVKLILEQQVSLASAAAAYRNLEIRLGSVQPAALLELDNDELKAIGFSRQKTRYARALATEIEAGELTLRSLHRLDDAAVIARLSKLVGIGPWTAANFCLFALGRPDIWPDGDRALVVSMQRALDLDAVPTYDAARELAEGWAPHRSVAARLLWHDYLGGPAYDPSSFG